MKLMKFKNHDEVFNYTMALNSEENIKKHKLSKQRVSPKIQGRNERCNCGSGKKFKKCCINKG